MHPPLPAALPGSLTVALLALASLCTPAAARAQDADVEGRTSAHAATLVSAIGELASRDVAGAICADSRHRRASVLVSALGARERRLRAAIARRDLVGQREERAVIAGLLDAIRELHAEAAACVGEALVPSAEPAEAEPRDSCIFELAPEVPRGAVRPPLAETPRSAVSE